jgi:hypothetical protein
LNLESFLPTFDLTEITFPNGLKISIRSASETVFGMYLTNKFDAKFLLIV